MMRAKTLENVPVKKNKFQLSHFNNFLATVANISVADGKVYDGLKIKSLDAYLSMAKSAVKFYNVGGRIFLFCLDDYLYEYKNGSISRFYNVASTEPPMLTEILKNGSKKILVVRTDDTAAVLGTTGDVEEVEGVKYGDYHELFSGMLFSAKSNELSHSAPLNMINFSTGLNGGGVIRFPDEFGEIVGVTKFDTKLYVFLTHAVFAVTTSGGRMNMKVEQLTLPHLNVMSGSIKNFGDQVYFISDGKLCSIKNQDIVEKTTAINVAQFNSAGQAIRQDKKYIVPVTVPYEEGNFFYVFDTETGAESFVKSYTTNVADGGFVENGRTSKIAMLDKGQGSVNGNRFFESRSIDFNSSEKKVLTDFIAYSDCECKLFISGDFGRREYALKPGLNKKRLNLCSANFVFRMEFSASGFNVGDVTIKYRIKGDN